MVDQHEIRFVTPNRTYVEEFKRVLDENYKLVVSTGIVENTKPPFPVPGVRAYFTVVSENEADEPDEEGEE